MATRKENSPESAASNEMPKPAFALAPPSMPGPLAVQQRRPVSFNEQLLHTSIWAAARAHRAPERALEWLAVGVGLDVGYFWFAWSRTTSLFVDLVVLILALGVGALMFVFERRRGNELSRLSHELLYYHDSLEDLAHEAASDRTAQFGEDPKS